MYCEKCNERIEKNWVFCPMCGNRIERIKINLSNTTVLREGTLRSLDYQTYTCKDVDLESLGFSNVEQLVIDLLNNGYKFNL